MIMVKFKSVHLRNFFNFYSLLAREKNIERKRKGKKLMKYLKELIVNIYYKI